MGINSDERTARVHDLDMQHQTDVHKTDLVSRDEEARLLKVRVVCLKDDNATLKEKLVQKEARVGTLAKQGDQARLQLDDAKEAARGQDARFKKQAIEMSNLKAEVDSLNEATQDSGKALQEKFALTRELNRMRPEMEHLKTQLANYDGMVSEKRDLQRQLDSIEVELENEKRSKQRTQTKGDDAALSELKSKLDKAEKKLAAEKKERETMKKDHERELAEAQGRSEMMEERVSGLKMKFKGVQSELKDAKSELEKARAELSNAKSAGRGAEERAKKTIISKPEVTRKRRQIESSLEDITIATPGNDDAASKRPAKKRGIDQSVLGEKSAFSITPFLNRSKNVSDDSIEAPASTTPMAATPEVARLEMEAESEAADEPESMAQPSPSPVKAKVRAPVAAKPRGRPKTKALAEAPDSEKNLSQPTLEDISKPMSMTMDDMSAEQPGAAGKENISTSQPEKPKKRVVLQPGPSESKSNIGNTSLLGGDGLKRKRKLLGGPTKVTFDDDDDDAPPRPVKAQVAPATRRLKAPLGGAGGAFGGKTFSPLKRDRRGVNASFLA